MTKPNLKLVDNNVRVKRTEKVVNILDFAKSNRLRLQANHNGGVQMVGTPDDAA